MCEVTPREVLEAFVSEYRAELVAEEEQRKAAAEAAKTNPKPATGRKRDNRIERCRAYLDTLPPSIEGQEGSKRVYHAARVIWNDFGIDGEEGYSLLEYYNTRSSPRWEEGGKQGLRRKWNEAVEKGPGPEGRGFRLEQDRSGYTPRHSTNGNHSKSQSDGGAVSPNSYPSSPPRDNTDGEQVYPSPVDGETWNDPHRLARLFVDERRTSEGEPTVLQWRDEFHAWNGAAWRSVPDSEFDSQIAGHCRKVFAADYPLRLKAWEKPDKKPTIFPVTAQVKTNMQLNLGGLVNLPDDGTDAPFWLNSTGDESAAEEIVSAPNGLFTLEGIARGSEPFSPPTPRFFTPNALPFAIPTGEPEIPQTWTRCLREWCNGDAATILGLQEAMGYLLSANTSAHKIILLVGPKRSGKGTVLRIITELVGAGNIASTSFAAMGDNFGLENLIGKRIAMIPDAHLSGRPDLAAVVERLLSISGEDAQSVNRKNKTRITTRLKVRFIVATNIVPRLPDASGALASRFFILNFPNSFFGKEDKDLELNLRPELPSILAWAAKGYVRFRKQGFTFTSNEAATQHQRTLEDLSSPVKAFVRERCNTGPAHSASVDEVYLAWQKWNEDNGVKDVTSKPIFGKDLQAAYPHLTVSQPRTDSGRIRVYRGISVREQMAWGNEDAESGA